MRISHCPDSHIVMDIPPLIENDTFLCFTFMFNGCCVMNVICMLLNCRWMLEIVCRDRDTVFYPRVCYVKSSSLG